MPRHAHDAVAVPAQLSGGPAHSGSVSSAPHAHQAAPPARGKQRSVACEGTGRQRTVVAGLRQQRPCALDSSVKRTSSGIFCSARLR